MDEQIRQRLNDINRTFYHVTAEEFDQTRGQAWRGWDMLLPHLNQPKSVLDVGCGNGRFGVYMAGKTDFYHGIDNNPTLLQIAGQALEGRIPKIRLENADLLTPITLSPPYSLVVVFGVLHHIPGYLARQAFIRAMAEQVAPGGVLAFACWRFYEFERFRERIVPWSDELADKVERHDYLLDWRRGEVALRYCHYVDDDEQAGFVRASGLREVATYRADGSTGMVNCYSILRNE